MFYRSTFSPLLSPSLALLIVRRMRFPRRLPVHYFSLAVLLFAGPLTIAENWPAWRGPQDNGISTETDLPTHWSATENVRWKAPLPDRGNSSPIVWNNRIFVTQAKDKY